MGSQNPPYLLSGDDSPLGNPPLIANGDSVFSWVKMLLGVNQSMELEIGDEILDALAKLAKCSRHAGLARASEALDDALILVFNGLCVDTRGKSRCEIDRFNDASCQGTAALIEAERNLAGDAVLCTRR